MAGKYASLGAHLERQSGASVRLRFSDVERIIGSALPASAREHQEWWGNHPGAHVQAVAWMDAGWRVSDVRLGDESVVFERAS